MLEREPGASGSQNSKHFHFLQNRNFAALSRTKPKMTTSSTTNPNHRSTMRRKPRRTTKTIAAACVLAATAPSGVEVFGQRPVVISAISMSGARHSSRISVGGGTASSSRMARTSVAKSHRRQTSLGYRDGDDDQSTSQRAQNVRAVSSSTASLQNPAQDVPPPASDSKRPGFLSLLNRSRRRKITARNNHTDSEQFKLDEYLEFIDKRYKRMHGSDYGQKVSSVSLRRQASEGSKKTSSRKTPSDAKEEDNGISTAWNWLMQGSSNADEEDCGCDAACQERKRQDALEVLGLAGLASAELLRKHQLPVPEEAAVVPIGTTGPSIASSTDIIDVQPAKETNGRLSLVATQHRLTRLTTLLALTIRSMLYKCIVSTLLAAKTLLSTLPTLPGKVGEMAGGRKTVKMATAVALGVFCVVVRPLGLLALRAGGQN